MKLIARVMKDGNDWLGSIDEIGLHTQGASRRDLSEMIADAIESLVNVKGFKVFVNGVDDETFVVSANDSKALFAYVLRYQRAKSGLSLAEVAEKLGSKSRNMFAQYERGKAAPSIEQAATLLAAASGESVEITLQTVGVTRASLTAATPKTATKSRTKRRAKSATAEAR